MQVFMSPDTPSRFHGVQVAGVRPDQADVFHSGFNGHMNQIRRGMGFSETTSGEQYKYRPAVIGRRQLCLAGGQKPFVCDLVAELALDDLPLLRRQRAEAGAQAVGAFNRIEQQIGHSIQRLQRHSRLRDFRRVAHVSEVDPEPPSDFLSGSPLSRAAMICRRLR
jgi:hypothetical protein